MNPATNADTGVFVHRLGVAQLLDVTFEHDGDPVAHPHCFFLVMGHEHERYSELALQQLQLDLHFLAQLAIQGAQRFVEQKNTRSVDKGPGDGDSLLLAARHLPGPALGQLRHLHHVERLVDPAATSDFGARF